MRLPAAAAARGIRRGCLAAPDLGDSPCRCAQLNPGGGVCEQASACQPACVPAHPLACRFDYEVPPANKSTGSGAMSYPNRIVAIQGKVGMLCTLCMPCCATCWRRRRRCRTSFWSSRSGASPLFPTLSCHVCAPAPAPGAPSYANIQTVTFERPIPYDIWPEAASVRLYSRAGNVTESGVEGLTFAFKWEPYNGHHLVRPGCILAGQGWFAQEWAVDSQNGPCLGASVGSGCWLADWLAD